MISRQLRFRDLKALGVVANRVTLKNLIDNCGFPPGRLIGPNTRTWSEPEVAAYMEARPTAPKPAHSKLSAPRRSTSDAA